MDQDRESAREHYQRMGTGEKLLHILRYYWWQFLLIGFLLVFLISFVGRFTFAKEKEASLGIAVHGKVMDPDVIDTLGPHFDERFERMCEEGTKEFKVYQFYNGYAAAQAEERTATIYRLAASIQTESLDVIIGDMESLDFDAGCGYLMDLRDVFSEEELQKIEEAAGKLTRRDDPAIITRDVSETSDTGRIISTRKDLPLLICIRGADRIIDESLAGRPVYIGIVSNAPNLDNVKDFILELLGI